MVQPEMTYYPAEAATDSNKMLKTMHMHAYLIGQSKVKEDKDPASSII